MKIMINLNKLHDQDFNLWIERTKEAIQNRDFENMDWDNLLDEIDDMGKSEKRSLGEHPILANRLSGNLSIKIRTA